MWNQWSEFRDSDGAFIVWDGISEARGDLHYGTILQMLYLIVFAVL
jgi:hypothetical protein